MKLTTKGTQAILCDLCLPDNTVIATIKCITCGKDICSSCIRTSYFEDYLPYELKGQYNFCKNCASTLKLLTVEDCKGWLPSKYQSGAWYDFDKQLKAYLADKLNKAHEAIQKEATKYFEKAILKSKEKYKIKIEKDKRKKELDDEIVKLERQKRDIDKKLDELSEDLPY